MKITVSPPGEREYTIHLRESELVRLYRAIGHSTPDQLLCTTHELMAMYDTISDALKK